jgi:DNA-directed RNA polymerase specialized sigma24 family protein
VKQTPSLEAIIFNLDSSDKKQEEIKRHVAALPLEYQQAIQLHYFEECTRKEIAARLNWSYAKVHNRLTRGVTLLKAELNPAYFHSMREIAKNMMASSIGSQPVHQKEER